MKTVMVVDDDYDVRKSIGDILKANRYDVIFAVNGDECLEELKRNKVDLILLDIRMPGTPVREVVRKITNVKVLYISAVQVSDAEKMGLLDQKNVQGFITKPFNIDDLIGAVREVIG
jgi:CheY-like chemotaxis protein